MMRLGARGVLLDPALKVRFGLSLSFSTNPIIQWDDQGVASWSDVLSLDPFEIEYLARGGRA
jgi:hypothetical protein